MAILNFGDAGTTTTKTYWNYKDDEKEGYTKKITGTLVAVEYRNNTDFASKQPTFDQKGNPKIDAVLTINVDGEDVVWWVNNYWRLCQVAQAIEEAKKDFIAQDANNAALITEPQANTPENLAGLNITVQAKKEKKVSKSGQNYSQWCFYITINGKGDCEYRGATSSVKTKEQILATPVEVSADDINKMIGAASNLNDDIPF